MLQVPIRNYSRQFQQIVQRGQTVTLKPREVAWIDEKIAFQYLSSKGDLRVDWTQAPIHTLRPLLTDDNRLQFTYAASLYNACGYGYSGEQIAKRLLTHPEADVSVIDNLGMDVDRLDRDVLAATKLSAAPNQAGFVYAIPTVFGLCPTPYRVGMTMWETTLLPPDWVEAANNLADEVWVPSATQVDIFRENKVYRPMRVVRLGVDTDVFTYRERSGRETFTVLVVGWLMHRKRPLDCMASWLKAVGNNPNWRLIIKSIGTNSNYWPKMDDRVTVINRPMDRDELIALYHEADCYFSMSAGEGYNLPLAEAMATGLECVFPKNTAMVDFADERYNYPIYESEMEWVTQYGDFKDAGYWHKPSQDEAVQRLQEAYENVRKEKRKGKRAARWVKKEHNWDITITQLLDNFRKYARGEH